MAMPSDQVPAPHSVGQLSRWQSPEAPPGLSWQAEPARRILPLSVTVSAGPGPVPLAGWARPAAGRRAATEGRLHESQGR
eukprot:478223-Hanusia_phi.AAC.3